MLIASTLTSTKPRNSEKKGKNMNVKILLAIASALLIAIGLVGEMRSVLIIGLGAMFAIVVAWLWKNTKAQPPISKRSSNGHTIRVMPKRAIELFVILGLVIILIGLTFSVIFNMWEPVILLSVSFLAYVASGATYVKQDKVATYLLFGESVGNLEPGFVLAPPIITRIVKLPSAIMRFVVGVRTDKTGNIIPNKAVSVEEIVITDDAQRFVLFTDSKIAKNLVPNPDKFDPKGHLKDEDWIPDPQWPAKEEGDETDPLQMAQTTSPVVAVLMKISDASKFLKATTSIPNAFGNVARVVEGALLNFSGKNTLKFSTAHASNFVEIIKRRVEWQVGDPQAKQRLDAIMDGLPETEKQKLDFVEWGVDLRDVVIADWGLSYNLNVSLESVPRAMLAKQVIIEEKKGEAEGIRRIGKAHAEAAKAMVEDKNSREYALWMAGMKASVEMVSKSKIAIVPADGGIASLTTTGIVVGQEVQRALAQKAAEDEKKPDNAETTQQDNSHGGGK